MSALESTGPDWLRKAEGVSLQIRDFINGQWTEGDGEVSEKFGPRDGRLLCKFHEATKTVSDKAVLTAREAFEDGRWSRLPVQQRKDALHKLSSLLEEHRDEFAIRECLDVGKPISDAFNFDVPAAAALIRFYAEAADKSYGPVYGADQSSLSYQLRRPIGVVAGIVGWNFPLLLAIGKIGPALAAGNSLVLKPSELTGFSAARVAELAVKAGVPEGVFNVVHGGPELGAALAHHLDVDLLSFTGSTQTGKQLLIAAGQSNLKGTVLECGGKAPNIVFDDSPNLDGVADAVLARAFWNQGQVCAASSRLLVQGSIKDELLRILVKKVSAQRTGDPLAADTQFGAVVSALHRNKIKDYVDGALSDGIPVAFRSSREPPHANGFYSPQVIFDEVLPEHRIAREEIFGPVLSVMTFRDEQEAIKMANGTIYGLSAILWTKDLGRAHRMTHAVRVGWMTVNATDRPSGGPPAGVLSVGGHKESGLGTEGGIEGMQEYTSKTAVQWFV